MVVARDSRNLIIVPRIFGHVVNMGDTSDMNEKSTRGLTFTFRIPPEEIIQLTLSKLLRPPRYFSMLCVLMGFAESDKK